MSPIMANSKDGQGHKGKYLDLVTRNALVQYESSNIYYEIMKPRKGVITKNTHVKYKSSRTHCSGRLLERLKFFPQNGSNSKVNVTG